MTTDKLPVSRMIDDARAVLRHLARNAPLNRECVGDLAIHVLALAGVALKTPAPMPSAETDRGFVRVDFKDYNHEECSLQESSIATENCVWLGIDCVTTGESGRMHLAQDQVRSLLPWLQRFADSGMLDDPEICRGCGCLGDGCACGED